MCHTYIWDCYAFGADKKLPWIYYWMERSLTGLPIRYLEATIPIRLVSFLILSLLLVKTWLEFVPRREDGVTFLVRIGPNLPCVRGAVANADTGVLGGLLGVLIRG